MASMWIQYLHKLFHLKRTNFFIFFFLIFFQKSKFLKIFTHLQYMINHSFARMFYLMLHCIQYIISILQNTFEVVRFCGDFLVFCKNVLICMKFHIRWNILANLILKTENYRKNQFFSNGTNGNLCINSFNVIF